LTICGCAAPRLSVNGGTARLAIPFDFPQPMNQESGVDIKDVYVGMPKADLEKAGYSESLKKNYRRQDQEEWITYRNWKYDSPDGVIVFYLVNGKVMGWEERSKSN